MEEALEILRADPWEVPSVAVAGSMSRTHFADHDVVHAVLEILRDTRLFRPVHAGKFPFDMYVEEICACMGLMDVMIGPEEREARLGDYERPVEILDGACLLVVFPREKESKTHKPGQELERIINHATNFGVPILSVTREGRTQITRTRT